MAEDIPHSPEKPDWALSRSERRARKRAADGLPPKRRRGWLIAVIVLALIAGAVLVLRARSAREVQATAPAEETARLIMQLTDAEMMTVAPATLRETVKVTGSLAPERQVHVSSEVSGRVEDVFVQPGDHVEAGQLLARIDVKALSNQLEQQRATAKATEAQLKLAQTQLDRTLSLQDRGLSTPSEVEASQAEVDQLAASLAAQQKQVENAEDDLEHAKIYAPFAGLVSARSVDPGAYVSTGTQLLTIVDLSEMQFEATVPVRFAPMLTTGLPVELTVEGAASGLVEGTVDRINPVAVEGTRMLPIYVGVENPDGLLRGGMFASGLLILADRPDAIGIPYDAVRTDDDGTYVLRIEDGRTVRQPVETGRNWSGGRVTEITSGLEPGDVIVSQPLSQLRAGTTIEFVGQGGRTSLGTSQAGE